MFVLALLAGVPVAGLVAAVVYLDAWRHGRPLAERLRRGGVVAAGSFGGFLVPAVFDDAFQRAYLHGLKPAPVVVSPVELLLVHLTVGAAVSGTALLVYWVWWRS